MATRHQQPRAAKEKHIVLPSADKEEEDKFGSSNTWGRNQLRLLGVDFVMNRRIDLNRVLRVTESEWSSEIRARDSLIPSPLIVAGVAEGARQMAAVDMNDLNSGAVDIDEVKSLAPEFTTTFISLLGVMEIREMKQRAKEIKQAGQMSSIPSSSGTIVTNLKRSTDSQAPVLHPKRVRATNDDTPPPRPEPRTPDQPTHPSNPDLTGGSTESKDEENTKKLLIDIVRNSMSVLEAGFRKILWQRSGCRVELSQSYSVSAVPADIKERETA